MADAARVGAQRAYDYARGARWFGWAGLVLVLISIPLFVLVPFAEADNRAYAAAPTCPAFTRSDTCRAAVEQTVADKDTGTTGRSTRYYLYLRGSGGAGGDERRVELPGDWPVYAMVSRGDRVTVTYWKDEIRAVRFGNRTQGAELSPAHDGRLPGAFAVATLAGGLGALSFWERGRRRPVRPGDVYPWGHAVGLLTGLVVACIGFPVVLKGDDVWTGLKGTAWALLPALLFTALLARWSMRRMGRGAARIVPVPPAGRRVLHALVHGDVPYSRPGYCYLVIGDRPLAATTDPTGHVALAPLPDTLRVCRVRQFLVGDPPFTPPRRGEYPLVVECADGDRTVLVLAGKKDVPRILGALLAAGGATADYVPSD